MLLSQTYGHSTGYDSFDEYMEDKYGEEFAFIYNITRRTDNYLTLYKAARKEGYQELAAAILSFYLFTQSYMSKGPLGEIAKIIPAIEESITGIGGEIVNRSLEIVVQIADTFPDYQHNKLLSLTLSPYLKKQGADVHLLSKHRDTKKQDQKILRYNLRRDKKEVIEDLNEILGHKEFACLQTRSRNYLIQAELRYRKLFQIPGSRNG